REMKRRRMSPAAGLTAAAIVVGSMLYAEGMPRQTPAQTGSTGQTASSTAPPPTGLIAGRVVDDAGAAIGAAIVTISANGRPAAAQPPPTLSGSDGRYFFKELPAG